MPGQISRQFFLLTEQKKQVLTGMGSVQSPPQGETERLGRHCVQALAELRLPCPQRLLSITRLHFQRDGNEFLTKHTTCVPNLGWGHSRQGGGKRGDTGPALVPGSTQHWQEQGEPAVSPGHLQVSIQSEQNSYLNAALKLPAQH